MGHEDVFPRPRLSARYRFSQRTFAGKRGNGRDAPIPTVRRQAENCRVRTPELSFNLSIAMTHRDPLRKSRHAR
jgi:hypothetical protein